MKTYTSLKAERTVVGGFLSLILIGTLLIWFFNFFSDPISLIDSLFTATSAVCVTGLAVVDTGKDLTPASQGVLLMLIQLGGLGVMTATTALLLLLRQKIGIRQRLFFVGGLGIDNPAGAVRLLMKILKITVIIEGMGAIPLFLVFLEDFPPLKSLYYAVFHSISAFCNAGFSPFPNSLEAYSTSMVIPGTVMMLIILGGIGFLVIVGVLAYVRGEARLSPYCRLVIWITGFLIFMGTVLILLADWNAGLKGLSPLWKIWNALFQSVTSRTAGFNTVRIAGSSSLSAFFICLLMIIGASPGSTGGGIKTTTFGILLVTILNGFKGHRKVVVWHRCVPPENILRALTLAVLYLVTIFLGCVVLSLLEPFSFRELMFEVISALGTVGLSMGITSSLSAAGKFVLVLLMFWGRVGILTFMYSILSRDIREIVSYADTNIPIG